MSVSEFDICVSYFVKEFFAKRNTNIESCEGTVLHTTSNPGPPKYSGHILENLDQVWAEDKWDENRIAEAEERIRAQGDNVSPFWREKYETQSGVFWHVSGFFQCNST